MSKSQQVFLVITLCGTIALSPLFAQEHQPPQTVHSPDRTISVAFRLDESGRPEGTIRSGDQKLALFDLSLELLEGGPLGDGMETVSIESVSRNRPYSIPVGKTAQARDQHNELTILLAQSRDHSRKLTLQIRVFDDGVAVRYVVPNQADRHAPLMLKDEQFSLVFYDDAMAWTLPLDGFTSNYERHYKMSRLSEVSAETLIGLRMLSRHDCGEQPPVWMALTEADLTDYVGMYVARSSGSRRNADHVTFVSKLSPLPQRADAAKVIGNAPLTSPWRVFMISDDLGRLIESDIIFHLNPPSRIADPSWIQPGKTTFGWWNGYVLDDVDFEPGVNTETMKHYIDFCADNGIPYHTLDGLDIAWYGGPIRPDGPVDVTRAAPSIDMPELLRYAKEKGVRLRLWMHWEALKPQLDQAFATYEQWGIEGVMIDFMDRDDQEMVRWYREVAEKAAKHQLTVTWHGAYKPTGMERTWPNVLSYEAVLNQEYNKWQPPGQGATPSHNLDAAFIRMLAGPLDYHQGGMRSVLPNDYTPSRKSPPVQGTRAHQLAMYIVYQNHLPMIADSPSHLRNQPELPFLVDIPATWDETRVLHAKMGECIVHARRWDKSWYVGGMTAGQACQLSLPTDFLSDGRFTAELYVDDESSLPNHTRQRREQIVSGDRLDVSLSPFGGLAGRIVPQDHR